MVNDILQTIETGEPTLDIPNDPAVPGLHAAAPDAMLRFCKLHLIAEPEQTRAAWRQCIATEAVYQPGRACRIAYQLVADDPERPDQIYARWSADDDRDHASAARVAVGDGAFDLFRYPRDRRLRSIRELRRSDWLQAKSQGWFEQRFGPGTFALHSWRCSPVKYVPESRLVCRLKGEWQSNDGASRWGRAYVRFSRAADVATQFQTLRGLERNISERRGVLRVPAAWGMSVQHNLLATEFIRGEAFRNVVARSGSEAIDYAVTALVAISELKCRAQETKNQLADIAPLAMLDELATADPECRQPAAALIAWAHSLPAPPLVARRVHGDLHAKQIILKNEHVWLVDWDRTCMGDPTRDIVNLAAEFDASAATEAPAGMAYAARCVETWRRAGGMYCSAAARWWAVHAHVLRAWGWMRHLRPKWRGLSRKLLARAVELDRRGGDWIS